MKKQQPVFAFLATAILTVSLIVCFFSATTLAQIDPTRAPLPGTWIMSISGIDGCGFGTKLVEVVLGDDLSMVVPVRVTNHTAGCGDSSPTNWTFRFTSLNPVGRGHAQLFCGPGCGWEY